jgi:hypothetical protein
VNGSLLVWADHLHLAFDVGVFEGGVLEGDRDVAVDEEDSPQAASFDW